jgi:hypothetical protein
MFRRKTDDACFMHGFDFKSISQIAVNPFGSVPKTVKVLYKCLILVPSSFDRLCGLVVRVLGCRSGGPGSIPGTTRKKSSGSGTGSTQPREYN